MRDNRGVFSRIAAQPWAKLRAQGKFEWFRGRQHHVPPFAVLVLLDPDDHELAIDPETLERDDFSGSETSPLGRIKGPRQDCCRW
jgi:hypothetical protein